MENPPPVVVVITPTRPPSLVVIEPKVDVAVCSACSALMMMDEGMGWPAEAQRAWRGVMRRESSRALSQLDLMQVTTEGRKWPSDS